MIKELEGGAIDNGAPALSRELRSSGQVAVQPRSAPKLMYQTDTHDVYSHKSTPMRTVYRQICENWTPILGRGHEPPDFSMMRQALEFDDTEFKDRKEYAYRPPVPPTGKGHKADDRETSHYVGSVLHSISPHLASVYRGGAINSHVEDSWLNRDFSYSRSR